MISPKTPENCELIPSASIIVANNVEINTSDMVLSTPCRVEDKKLKRIRELTNLLKHGSPSATARLKLLRQLEEAKAAKNLVPDMYRDEIDIITTQEREYRPLETVQEIFATETLFVDIRTDGDNRTEGVKKKLREDGVKVTDVVQEATVVIFSKGLKSVYDQAKLHNKPLCTLLWIEACKQHKKLIDYKDHPVPNLERYENPELFKQRRRKSLQPNGSVFMVKKKPRRNKIKLSKPKILILTPPLGDRTTNTPVSIDVSVQAQAVFTNRHGTQIFDADYMEASAHRDFNKPQPLVQEPSLESLSLSDMIETPIRKRASAPEVDLDKTMRPRRAPILPLQPLHSTMINPENEVHPMFNCSSPKEKSLLRRSLENKNGTEPEPAEKKILQDDQQAFQSSERPKLRKRRRLFNPNATSQDTTPTNPNMVVEVDVHAIEPAPVTPRQNLEVPNPQMENIPHNAIVNVETPKVKLFKKFPKKSIKPQVAKKQTLPRKTDNLTEPSRRIAFSCLTNESKAVLVETVDELKDCQIVEKVTARTTHLIMQKPYSKTEKLLLAIVRGIWVLDFNYIVECRKSKTWLWEEVFEVRDFLPGIIVTRANREIFGKDHLLSLLKGKNIYVEPEMRGDAQGVERFVKLLGGVIVPKEIAAYIICETVPANINEIQVCATTKWITDSISEAFLKNVSEYIVR